MNTLTNNQNQNNQNQNNQNQNNQNQNNQNNQTAAELLKIIKSGGGNDDIYRMLLDKDPPHVWLKKHPINNFNYLPIDKVELLLDKIFKTWSVQVIDYRVIANSICVHIKLTVVDYNGNERVFDGLGAAPIQTKSGASPVDQNAILTDAVMKALPAAKSFAIKDAAEHLGPIFGRNINRVYVHSIPVQTHQISNTTSDVNNIVSNIKERINIIKNK